MIKGSIECMECGFKVHGTLAMMNSIMARHLNNNHENMGGSIKVI